ncbi:5'-3' exonuclease [Sutcliffiella cohnii]|uniref:5'-3' exonuclease n=1 Tax=Sutcliffiella cohnii TaxID=33932 RepID=A0A223KQ89_9BACI|nr:MULTISPECIES: 5'-3' exonuclease H3TH domain-containing protein [Sutcliffiella]AST91671.1 flap endonuclease [Sutcliffiella cohnii]MED4014740.1 5'-3' exonuclease H3TH domain-containing protein [Sutcliffiella cohnii]WBL12893.1 5'-3' exonuclease [Sutcliffiella sp. NC1]
MKKVLLIDGMALLFRSFYATSVYNRFMYTSNGIPTNGVQGFVKHMVTAVESFNPTHIVCCWDMGSKTFRTEMFDEYKGNRPAPPEQLVPQFDLVKEVVEAFDIPNIGLKGYEADDCIGTLTNKYRNEAEVIILTGDQDILQLLKNNVKVALIRNGYGNYEVFDHDGFVEKKGLTPEQLIDLKAIMGDPSDNYPGVKGIGEKTATKLLLEYKSIEGILNNISSLTKAQQKKFEEGMDLLHLSRKLAEIHCEVPVECSLEEASITINREKVFSKFDELEFKNLHSIVNKVC